MMPVVAALLRTDLRYFVQRVFSTVFPGSDYLSNWHIEAIVYQLMRIHAGECRRLLINQPPRSLKSLAVSVAFVAWLLGHDPSRRIIVVSYASELSAELHRQFRMVIESGWYQELFPAMRPAKDTGTELVTTAGGSRYATTVGGTLTGRGADFIIIDDPLKAEEALSEPGRNRVTDWFGGTLVSRLNDKETGRIIVVMQRLHEDDLAGHLLQAGGWHHLDLQPSPSKIATSPSAPIASFAAALATSYTRGAKASRCCSGSRPKSAACNSRRNTSNGRSRSRAI